MMGLGKPKRDPNFANLKAGLHLNGTNGSTTITDIKGNTWTVNAATAITTLSGNLRTPKFNGSCLALGNSTDQISTSGTINPGAGQYTVSGWVMQVSYAGNQGFFDNRFGGQGICMYLAIGGNGTVRVANNGALFGSAVTVGPLNLWNYYTLCRDGGNNIYIGVNGTVTNVGTDARTLAPTTTVFGNDNSGTSPLASGYLQDCEIYTGVAIYTANFTPPTQPFLNQ